jgi:hypothetical protein
MEKEMNYTGAYEKYDHQRYQDATRKLRELVLHDTIGAQVAVTFGAGTELAQSREARECWACASITAGPRRLAL